jgi:hypothetical protein
VQRKKCCVALVGALALAGGASNVQAATPPLEAPTVAILPPGSAASPAAAHPSSRRLAAVSWWGRTYTVAGGETVKVFVSTTYPAADAVAQRWADFFASLPHAFELSRLTAYIAPIEEVRELCGSSNVLGCYGGGGLVTVGDSSAGVSPAGVAAHEYGHHIAANRLNSPWLALGWGTKRWSTYVNVCSRTAGGTAFPGDEGAMYSLNPGEAFAESYRVLVETGGTATGFDWNIVDPSFVPDPAALALVKEDVFEAWSPRSPRLVPITFPRGSRSRRLEVATPLDGVAEVRLAGRGAAVDLSLISADGHKLASGVWDNSGGISAQAVVCGSRKLVVRVTRHGPARRFSLRLSIP